jgi:RNA polymerase sigma factor (sigma-70 family)
VADDDQSAFDAPLEALLRAYATASPADRPPIAEKLYERVEPMVIAVWHLAALEKDSVEVGDFVQDVFLDVFDKLRRLETPATFRALLSRITKGVIEKARRTTPPPTVDLKQVEGLPVRIDEAITISIEYDSLIQQLSPAERRVLERETAGLDPIEILARLNEGGISNTALAPVISHLRENMKRNARRLRKLVEERRKKRS